MNFIPFDWKTSSKRSSRQNGFLSIVNSMNSCYEPQKVHQIKKKKKRKPRACNILLPFHVLVPFCFAVRSVNCVQHFKQTRILYRSNHINTLSSRFMSSFPIYTLKSRARNNATQEHKTTTEKKYIKNNNNRYDIAQHYVCVYTRWHELRSFEAYEQTAAFLCSFGMVVPKKVEMLYGVQQGFGKNGVSLVDCCFSHVDRMSFVWFFRFF